MEWRGSKRGTVAAVLFGAARLGVLVEWDARRLELHVAGRRGGHDAQRPIGLWQQEMAEEAFQVASAIVRTVHAFATVRGWCLETGWYPCAH